MARLLAGGESSRALVNGAARGVLQREIRTKPDDIETDQGPTEARPILIRLRDGLKAYYGARRSEERFSLLKLMHRNILDWLAAYKASPAATGGGSRVNFKLGIFKTEIDDELPGATEQSEYVEQMRLGKFEYTSFESGGQVRMAEALMVGETPKGYEKLNPEEIAAKGMGPQALSLVRDFGLTEAETLAIKVYSVGDYRAINATLGLYDDNRLTTALHEMGLVKDRNKVPVLPPEGVVAPQDPAKKALWEKQKAKFGWYASAFKPDLAKVKAEALRHAEILKSAFRKMPRFDSARDKSTWRGMRLDPQWPDYTSFTTQHSIIAVKNYVSTSKDRGQGERFASKKTNDGRKGLLLECVLKNGRDISMLSEHGAEKEVLLLPGAQLKVLKATPAHASLPYDWLVKVEEQ